MNICQEIFQKADPAHPALIAGDITITFGELAGTVHALADAIQVPHTARIGLYCKDGVEHIALALALLRNGHCVIPIAGELTQHERLALADSTALHAVITCGACGWDEPGTHCQMIQNGDITAQIWHRPTPRHASFEEENFSALNPAFVRFSSGTTGASKGIVLSHETLLARIRAANAGLQIGPDDRVLWILPMAHHFAVSIILYLWHGATTVLTSSHLADALLTAARKHGATVVYGAPFHHRLLAAESSGLPWPTLRLAISTASALPAATAEAFRKRYSIPLVQGFGVIEVGLPCLNLASAITKPESIGRSLPGFQISLRNSKGEVGELFIRGAGICDAYLSPWQTREDILQDGWFCTGDLARMDADGDLFLAGRSSSVINVGGLKCFPEEVEAVLNEHPCVQLSRVCGREHAQFGAVPVAEVVPVDAASPPSRSELLSFCRERLARFKIPVDYKFVAEVPRTPSGKIKRGVDWQEAATLEAEQTPPKAG